MGSLSPLEKNKSRNKCRRWRLFVSCGKDEYGRRIQRSRNVRGSYTEAKEELVKFENECLGITARDATFASYARNYLERRKPTLKESTYINRKSVVDTLIKIFGKDIKLSQMNPHDIEKKMNELLVHGVHSNKSQPCKPSYVASLYTYLSSIFLDAVNNGVIMKNPLNGIKRPSGKAPRPDVPSLEELVELTYELDYHNKSEMCVLLIAFLGLRRGEALALRWCDVDFDKNVINIKHNLTSNCELTSPKTEASIRTLPIPERLLNILKARKVLVERDMKRAVRAEKLTDYNIDEVFVVCDQLGRPYAPERQTYWWYHNRDKFGMNDVTEHNLRHAYITALAVSGVHPTVAQSLAGHATMTMTMDIYSHVDIDAKRNGVEAFNSKMNDSDKHDFINEYDYDE